jgi:hypothetical protein
MEFDHNQFLLIATINEVCTRQWPQHTLNMDYYDFLVSMFIEKQRVKERVFFEPPVQF